MDTIFEIESFEQKIFIINVLLQSEVMKNVWILLEYTNH